MENSTFSFTQINAWQRAHQFTKLVYKAVVNFPEYERYGLSSQFQRAAVSIPANIAEGYKRLSKAEKLRFMNIAQGSLEECRYYIILSYDLQYIDDGTYDELINVIENTSRLLNAYVKSIVEDKGVSDAFV